MIRQFGKPVEKIVGGKKLQEVSSGENFCSEIQNFRFRKRAEDNLKVGELKSDIDRGGKEMTRRGENWLRNITRKYQTEEKFKSPCSARACQFYEKCHLKKAVVIKWKTFVC